MDTIERLKKYMEDNKLDANDIVFETRIPLVSIVRWLKGKNISLAYDKILNEYLTIKGY